MSRLHTVSTGHDYLNPKVRVQSVTDEQMVARLRRFHIVELTRAEYQKLEVREKAAIKKASGFLIGGDGDGLKTRDSWKFSSIATLDLDDLTPDRAAASIDALKALGAHTAIYSTASHSPEKPRLRAVIFLAEDVRRDDYAHLIDRLASRLPPGAVSSESFKPTQIMYLPQRCSDGEEFFVELPGEPLDPTPLLAEPRVKAESDRADKVTPAWNKPGIVGAVARRYEGDLDAAIEELGIESIPYDRASAGPTCAIGETRYTRVGASGADGALWYGDDGHMYSHHGASDPGAGSNQTIFDIVRLTRFKELDKGVPPGTQLHELPSHKATAAWFIERFPDLQPVLKANEEFENLGEEEFAASEQPTQKRSSRFTPIPVSAFSDGPEPDWLIDQVYPLGGEFAIVYAESGVGKSFFVMDQSLAIARGVPWHGRATKQGKVVYVCGESPGGFRKRFRAYAHHHEINLNDLDDCMFLIGDAPNLLKADEVKELRDQLKALGTLAIVVIDTLARATPGANENSGEDMGKALKHCQFLHKETGALVVLIHHSGKDQARGARGWSGIRAAADTEIEITRQGVGNHRLATISKQRDGEDGLRFGFELIKQPYGFDSKGAELSSLVAKPMTAAANRPKAAPPLTSPSQVVVLKTLQEAGGSLDMSELLALASAKLPRDPGDTDRRRQYAKRGIEQLVAKERVVVNGDVVSLIGVATTAEFDAVEEDKAPAPTKETALEKPEPPLKPKKRRATPPASSPPKSGARKSETATRSKPVSTPAEQPENAPPKPPRATAEDDPLDETWMRAKPAPVQTPQQRLMQQLDIDGDTAARFVDAGFESIEAIREAQRFVHISGYAEDYLRGLQNRARDIGN